MRTINLDPEHRDIEEILELAEGQDLLVRTASGKTFFVTEVSSEDTEEDFSDEVALTRQNRALRKLLAERSKEPGKHSLDDVRRRLGLVRRSE